MHVGNARASPVVIAQKPGKRLHLAFGNMDSTARLALRIPLSADILESLNRAFILTMETSLDS